MNKDEKYCSCEDSVTRDFSDGQGNFMGRVCTQCGKKVIISSLNPTYLKEVYSGNEQPFREKIFRPWPE